MSPIEWTWLGRVPYGQTLDRQRSRREAVIAGIKPEVIWFLEHEPVITTGKRPVHDLPSVEVLHRHGIDLAHTERGGMATYHGPGQLVAYPIIDAWSRGLGAKGTIHALEDAVIAWLAQLDICADRRAGFPGVWVEKEKICAIGMHFSKGISMHGIALNLNPDLAAYDLFTPCGIQDGGITSVAQINGVATSPKEAAMTLAPQIARRLMRPCPPRSCGKG